MAKLILSMDNLALKEIPIEKERTLIGRKPHNDIQIDNLAISGEHAVVVTILHDSFLEDLDSTNGTFVNGRQIKKHFLQNNDVIELGKYRLKYVKDPIQTTARPDFEKTMVLRPELLRKAVGDPGAAPRAAEAVAEVPPPIQSSPPIPPRGTRYVPPPRPVSAPPPAYASPPPAYPARPTAYARTPAAVVPGAAPAASAAPLPLGAIQVLTGSNAGKTLDLVKSLTTLGKPGVQVAVIARRPHGYFLTHVEGVRFPLVNGKVIDVQAHGLNDHDIIELAGVKMEFFLKD